MKFEIAYFETSEFDWEDDEIQIIYLTCDDWQSVLDVALKYCSVHSEAVGRLCYLHSIEIFNRN